MKKGFLCTILIIVGLVLIVGCGNSKLASYAGTYQLEYSKYVGDPETAKSTEDWTMILEADGTGKSNRDGNSYNIEWSIDGDNITLKERFGTLTIDYNGTIQNGKIDAFNGNKTDALTLEVVFNKE